MAINFSNLGGGGGGSSSGPVEIIPVPSTGGAFNVDLTAGSAFSLDFTESYFDTLGYGYTPNSTPEVIGYQTYGVSNGGEITFSTNTFTDISGSGTVYAQNNDVILLAVTDSVNTNNVGTFLSGGSDWAEVAAVNGGYTDVSAQVHVYSDLDPSTYTLSQVGSSSSGHVAILYLIRGVDVTDINDSVASVVTWVSSNTAGFPSPITTNSAYDLIVYVEQLTHTSATEAFTLSAELDNFISLGWNETYDPALAMATDSAGDAGLYVPSNPAFAHIAGSKYSGASFLIAFKGLQKPSGVGPDATLNISSASSGAHDVTFYYKNTNSTEQQYDLLGGTGFTSANLASVSYQSSLLSFSRSFVDGIELSGGGTQKSKKTVRITSTGIYELPTDVSGLKITAVGGGGAGSFLNNSYGGGGGGGAGQYLEYECPVDAAGIGSVKAGSALTITIGAGGSGNATNGTFPGFGGTTRVESGGYLVCEAYGGAGGDITRGFSTGLASRTVKFGSGGGGYNDYHAGGGGGAAGPAHSETYSTYTNSSYGSVPGGGGGGMAMYGHGGGIGGPGPSAEHGGPGKNGLAGGGGGGGGRNSYQYEGGIGSDGGGHGGHGYAGYSSTPAEPNTGSGGGGRGNLGVPSDSNGGSGIVILEYWTAA